MSNAAPGGWASFGLLIGRVTIGLQMLSLHGWDKYQGFSELKESFPDPAGIGSDKSLMVAVAAEVFASALLILGFGTRLAAFALAGVLGVAAFGHHLDDDWATKEKALLYCGGALLLMFTGAGRFSVDAYAFRKKG